MPEDPKKYLKKVNKTYWQGKENGKLYPVDAGDSMLAMAIQENGGLRVCSQCGEEKLIERPYHVCADCRHKNLYKKWESAKTEPIGSVLVSLRSGNYGSDLDDFLEEASDHLCIDEDELNDDDIIRACLIAHPDPNFASEVCWENLTGDVQPPEEWIEPSKEVEDAIKNINELLKEERPISYGPGWTTRPALSTENKQVEK